MPLKRTDQSSSLDMGVSISSILSLDVASYEEVGACSDGRVYSSWNGAGKLAEVSRIKLIRSLQIGPKAPDIRQRATAP